MAHMVKVRYAPKAGAGFVYPGLRRAQVLEVSAEEAKGLVAGGSFELLEQLEDSALVDGKAPKGGARGKVNADG